MFRGIVSQCIVSLNVFCNADDQVNYAAKPVTFIRNTERQVVILNYKSPQGEQEQYEETPWSQKDSTRCNGHFILHFGIFVQCSHEVRGGPLCFCYHKNHRFLYKSNHEYTNPYEIIQQIHKALFFFHKRNAGNNV